jgi:hypothetical protein
VTPDCITLTIWPLRYTFEKASIQKLVKKPLMGWSSLQIVHGIPRLSRIIAFIPLRFSDLESMLARNGYSLTTDETHASSDAARGPNFHSKAILAGTFIATLFGGVAALAAMLAVVIGAAAALFSVIGEK